MSKLKLSKISTCFACLTCLNNGNTRTKCKIYLNLSIKTPNDVIDVVLVFLVLTLNRFHTFYGVLADFKKLNAGCVHENIKINRILRTDDCRKITVFFNFHEFCNYIFSIVSFYYLAPKKCPLHNSFRKIFSVKISDKFLSSFKKDHQKQMQSYFL